MNKRLLIAATTVMLLLPLLACGCAQEPAAGETPEFWLDELPVWVSNEFYLDQLPEIAPYQQPEEIISRWYADETPQLLPRDDYGPLYSYVGRRLADGIGPNMLYGLCDVEGHIVTDAGYIGVVPYYREDGLRLLALEEQPDVNATDDELDQRWAVAASAGSWVLDGLRGQLRYADEELLIVENPTSNWDLGESNCYVYDYQGNLKASYEDIIVNGYADGVLAVYFYNQGSTEDWYSQVTLRVIGGDDYTPVQDAASGLWGMANAAGEYLIAPEYATEQELDESIFADAHNGYDYDSWRNYENLDIDGMEYTIYRYEDGLYSVWSYASDYAGIVDEEYNWLLRLKVRNGI